jgi:hypothetical protein
MSSEKSPFVLVYRKKEISFGTEIRVAECMGEPGQAVRSLMACEPASGFITASGAGESLFTPGFFRLKVGPAVTLLNLSRSAWLENLSFAEWAPSLGDLELF